MNCQIEFANDDVGMPCGKTAVAKCSDCGCALARFVHSGTVCNCV